MGQGQSGGLGMPNGMNKKGANKDKKKKKKAERPKPPGRVGKKKKKGTTSIIKIANSKSINKM